MPRRGGGRRARARRVGRRHIAGRQRHAHRRHRRRNRARSGNATRRRAVPDSHHPLKHWIMALLMLGVTSICAGLALVFEISVVAGIVPLSLGALFVTIVICLYIILRKKSQGRTIQVTATALPQNSSTVAIRETAAPAQSANYLQNIPIYSFPVSSTPSDVYPSANIHEVPPPSYAEATMVK